MIRVCVILSDSIYPSISRYDPFDSVTLTIPSNRTPVPELSSGLSLDQLLLSFVSREPVRDVECRGCSRMLGRKPGEMRKRGRYIISITDVIE